MAIEDLIQKHAIDNADQVDLQRRATALAEALAGHDARLAQVQAEVDARKVDAEETRNARLAEVDDGLAATLAEIEKQRATLEENAKRAQETADADKAAAEQHYKDTIEQFGKIIESVHAEREAREQALIETDKALTE